MNVKEKILDIAEKDYKQFSASLIPNIDNVLGVRIPALRQLAKEVYKESGIEYLSCDDTEYMEEVMLQGMIIGFIKDSPDKILEHVEKFIPKINNWAVCDIFCGDLKEVGKNPAPFYQEFKTYQHSAREYEIRFFYGILFKNI
mgnify:CR=1 FL=1